MSARTCARCSASLRTKQKLYCSAKCQAEGQRIVRTARCKNCGKLLIKQQLNYCSRRCYSAAVIEQSLDDPLREPLTRLWDEGLTTAEIGRQLGIKKNAVIGKAHRMGLPARPSPILPPRETPRQSAFQVRLCLHDDRAIAGPEALPPMHPISWGAIAL